MPRIELYDTVVLKSDRKLYGTVERTHYENHEPLQDQLIVRHAPVETSTLAAFATSGIPPKDHVFIYFADEAQGSALVREDQIELVSRWLDIGDVVKCDGSSMQGTVVSCKEKYTLQPAWRRESDETVTSAAPSSTESSHSCDETCVHSYNSGIKHARPHELIFDVPGTEIKNSEDIVETDIVTCDGWVGVVEDVEPHVTLLLEDGSIVVVEYAGELYIPVPDFDKPIVSLPEYDQDLARPDVLVAQRGWPRLIPLLPDHIHAGKFVVTSSRNLRNGRWLRGHYDRELPCEGHIVDARSREFSVRWIAPDPVLGQNSAHATPPPTLISFYENINLFPSRPELRRNKKVRLYDQSKLPPSVEDRRRNRVESPSSKSQVAACALLRVGDHVKFRDPAGAAVKYHGTTSQDGTSHGRFDRIPGSSVLGFDLNDLKIIWGQQQVQVRWQDGSTSDHGSQDLFRPGLFEPDFKPSDIVIGKEGLKQRQIITSDDGTNTYSSWAAFNEMTYFEQPHELNAQKVGIVQNFDPVERIAQVRWYVEPEVRLYNAGYVMGGQSRFGLLGTEIEDVSSYEITIFAALTRSLRDSVIIMPTRSPEPEPELESERRLGLTHGEEISQYIGSTVISSIKVNQRQMWLRRVLADMFQGYNAPFAADVTVESRNKTPIDWFGLIVGLSLDGFVTVRANAGEYCYDVMIEHDQIIASVDETALAGGEFEDTSMLDDSSQTDDSETYDSDNVSAIEESIEYEGGQRLDNDDDDENWEDSEDAMSLDHGDVAVGSPPSINVPRAQAFQPATKTDETISIQAKLNAEHAQITDNSLDINAFIQLREWSNKDPPPQFAILEREPPTDQYQPLGTMASNNAGIFMRRVLKEHKALLSSLPVNEIYVRTYENRLDLMRCLIIGPADTPYEFAPFLVDLQFPPGYPVEPPVAHFHSWTSGMGRINPNLYETGKICLSLLGTWQGKGSETWSEKATILQLLVSLQALVLVREPFYNEAGFEGRAESQEYRVESRRYSEEAFLVARKFVLHALQHPVAGLEDVLAWVYVAPRGMRLSDTILKRSKRLIELAEARKANIEGEEDDKLTNGEGSPADPTKAFLKTLSRGGVVMLKKTVKLLDSMVAHVSQERVEEQHA